MYPELEGVTDQTVLKEIVKLTKKNLPITTVARNIDFEFYWQQKCEQEEEELAEDKQKHKDKTGKDKGGKLDPNAIDPRIEKLDKDIMRYKNIKREQHGNSYKQAYIENHIQTLLENFKSEGSKDQVIKELEAARYEVFRLVITQLQRFDITYVFEYLPNLAHLTLTYGAKHIGMEYERPLFGMKMSDAETLKANLRKTTSLVYLSLPGNLIDDDLIGILIKGLMLNKTITQLDLSHNKIGQSGARKIAKYLL